MAHYLLVVQKQLQPKSLSFMKDLGITRFMLHLPVGSMPHEKVMKSIKLLGEKLSQLLMII